MKARIWSATCLAIALGTTVGLLAQDAQSSQTPSQSTSAKTITVTGCVNRAQPSPTGTAGAGGAASKATETKFVLTNASLNPSGPAGTTGATAPAATAIASEYKLDAEDSQLTPEVGHKVEISGTVEQPMSGEQKPPASAANAPTLKVVTVKMVSSTCS